MRYGILPKQEHKQLMTLHKKALPPNQTVQRQHFDTADLYKRSFPYEK